MTEARWFRKWVPGDLVTSSDDVRWSGYVRPSGDNQRIIWRSGMCPDVYPGIDAELEIKIIIINSQAS